MLHRGDGEGALAPDLDEEEAPSLPAPRPVATYATEDDPDTRDRLLAYIRDVLARAKR